MHATIAALLTTLALALIDALIVRNFGWFAEQGIGRRFLFNQLLSFATLLSFIYLLQSLRPKRIALRVAIPALFAVTAFVQAAHFSIYRELVSPFGLLFFLENPLLTLRAGAGEMSWARAVGASIVTAAVIFFVPRKPLRTWIRSTIILFLIAGIGFTSVFWMSVPSQQNCFVAASSALLDSARLFSFKERKFARPKLEPVTPRTDAPNIVWIIGESLNRDHMSLFGYERNTTPELDAMHAEGKLIPFSNVTTIGIHTLIAVPYMLSGMEGIDPHGIIFSRPTAFAYAHAAGYRTAFVSAQDTRWGQLETLIGAEDVDFFRNANAYSPNVSVHKGADDLEVVTRGLIPFVQEKVSKKERFLAVMQMDGSHYPYTEHSPAAFKRFLPEEKRNSLNAYDNTVVYTDHVLATLVREVHMLDPKAWIIYTSDHADGVKRYNSMFHTPTSRGLMHVPMMIFPPVEPAPERNALTQNAKAPVSESDLLPTVLDLIGVKAQAPLDGFSLLSPISDSRVRVVSAYMSTLSPDPIAMLVFPDNTTYRVDLERKNVTVSSTNETMKLEDLDESLRRRFEERLGDQTK